MKILDVEIYIKQFVDFFEKNPNDLLDLIGDVLKDEFYKKVKEQSTINYNDGKDVNLTRNQLIDIVVKLKKGVPSSKTEKVLNGLFEETKFGTICLN